MVPDREIAGILPRRRDALNNRARGAASTDARSLSIAEWIPSGPGVEFGRIMLSMFSTLSGEMFSQSMRAFVRTGSRFSGLWSS